jgi:hypothetical protein
VHCCFAIRSEKIDVKHGVNAPLCGKFKAIVDSGHHLNDLKGAMSSWRKLGGWLIDTEVLSFYPYLVTFLVFGGVTVFHP